MDLFHSMSIRDQLLNDARLQRISEFQVNPVVYQTECQGRCRLTQQLE